jgi:hypothetical protein
MIGLDAVAVWVVATSGQLQTIAGAVPTIVGSLMTIAGGVVSVMLMFSGACASVATWLPEPEGTGFLSRVHKWINLLGFNFGVAANALKKGIE